MKKGTKGIDISRYQNFTVETMKKIKEAGFEFVIIRSSYGTWKDIRFEQHYAAAIEAKLKVGAYHYYNYADEEASANETATFLDAIKGKALDLGAYIDFENRGDYAKGRHLGMLTPEKVTDRAIAAITSIKEAGFSAGIYCDTDWAKHKMNMKRLPANTIFWIADWKGKLDFNPCDIRQYSSTEVILGVGSGIDMNELQRDFDEPIPSPEEEPCLFAVKVVRDTWVRESPNGKKKEVAHAKDNLTLGISETSGNWGRIQNQPASWISINPRYTGVIRT